MPDETQRPHEAEPQPEYDPPQAEDMPDPSGPVGTAPAIETGQDNSDRDLKTGFAEVDADATLARVRELPITTWSYLEDDPAVRHIGPMAQDFAAAFAVGEDDRHIHTVDANGVALAAIQALAARLERAEAGLGLSKGRAEAARYEPPHVEELERDETAAASPGGAVTSPPSDRNVKRDFAEVDVEATLAAVRGLPITTWSYREDDPAVPHIGPMAQDFAVAFGVGDDDRRIHTVDANGVALAAIQALAARLEAAEARIAELTAVHS
jgi:hypothetical protein